MYTWPGTPFNGDRYKFEEYLEVLTQQLRANNCLKIAKNEEEPQQQQQQQQQQQGGNPTNAPGPFLSLEIILETFFKTQHHLHDLPKTTDFRCRPQSYCLENVGQPSQKK